MEDKGKVKISLYISPEQKKVYEEWAARSHRSLNQYCQWLMILGFDAETERIKKLDAKQLNTGKTIWDMVHSVDSADMRRA